MEVIDVTLDLDCVVWIRLADEVSACRVDVLQTSLILGQLVADRLKAAKTNVPKNSC